MIWKIINTKGFKISQYKLLKTSLYKLFMDFIISFESQSALIASPSDIKDLFLLLKAETVTAVRVNVHGSHLL